MNLSQFKDCVFHICLVGTLATSWFLTQEVVDLYYNDSYFLSVNSRKTFKENSNIYTFTEGISEEYFTLPVYVCYQIINKEILYRRIFIFRSGFEF